MEDITEILDMLDWHMPLAVQSRGRSFARNTGTILPFLQPVTPRHNKNVWGNCAAIISEKSDEYLRPYLVELLEWLRDMTWPGAFCILHRLQEYADQASIRQAIHICLEKAKTDNDPV